MNLIYHNPNITSPDDSISDFFVDDFEEATGELKELFLPAIPESKLIKGAWDATYRAPILEVASEARKLLMKLQETTSSLQLMGIDFDYVPILQLFHVDDGSILIEWIFSDFRIGFSIEPNFEESSWYLVSKKNMGGINASGNLENMDIKSLFLWLFYFVALHL